MKSLISKVILISMFVCAPAMAGTDTAPLRSFADGAPIGGWSHLTRTEGGMILATLEVVGLVPGDAVTLWWIVFNDPGSCSTSPCSDVEFGDVTNAQIAVGNATGNVVKSDGTLEFGAVLREGANEPGHQVLFIATQSGDFLDDAYGAEVHFIVQIHGQARGGKKLREQLSMVDTNCTPSCADVQFAIHQAPSP